LLVVVIVFLLVVPTGIWHDLAAVTKLFEGTTIDHAVAAMVLTLGISSDMAPFIMPSALTMKIISFTFGHLDSDDLEQEGIHPFTVGYHTLAKANLARQLSRQPERLPDGVAPRLTG
jgi:hypothetical protein